MGGGKRGGGQGQGGTESHSKEVGRGAAQAGGGLFCQRRGEGGRGYVVVGHGQRLAAAQEPVDGGGPGRALVDDQVGLAAVRVVVAQREAGAGVVAEAELREDLRREAGGSQGVTHLQRVVADRVVRGQHRDDLVDGAHR